MIRNTFFLLIIMVGFIIPTDAQLCDDFSDGDILIDPTWAGQVNDFEVNVDGELMLNASSAGQSIIHLPIALIGDVQWEFYTRLEFAPSTSNLLKIYLGASESDLSQGDGYYLQIGSTGNTDPIQFYRQSGGLENLIAQSEEGIVANDPVNVRIKVTKVGDLWNFFADLIGGDEFSLLFSTNESAIQIETLPFFGIDCKYSESRKDKFFFDDLCIGVFEPDTDPPVWNGLEVVDASTIKLSFNETLNENSETVGRYFLSPPDVLPTSAIVEDNEVTLSFAETFVDGTQYLVTVLGVEDTLGNLSPLLEMTFDYFEFTDAEEFDILINELMADPTPQIALPNAEFIELYHNGIGTLDLADYDIRIGTSRRPLPSYNFLTDTYVIICDVDDVELFESFGEVLGVLNFPALSNSGTNVAVVNKFEDVIHEIEYDLSWYRDTEKDNGGWSLELINPSNVCATQINWIASEDLSGGTPGRENSVQDNAPDVDGPRLIDVIPFDGSRLLLLFDENIEDGVVDLSSFQTNPPLNLGGAFVSGLSEITLAFSEPFELGVEYTLTIGMINDCQGNSSTGLTRRFGAPETIEPGDLIISEILFNPQTGGARFIEVQNVSNKIFQTSDLVIGEITPSETDLEAVAENVLIFPGDYIAFSINRADILARYSVPFPNQLINADLPGWNNEQGNATILSQGMVLDSFSYSEDWHNPLVDDVNGVSLERVSVMASSTDQNTWHSAAEIAGFATPTGKNSQSRVLEPSELQFSFASKTFSPDEDGFEDFLVIQFSNEVIDAAATITIFDSVGRKVRDLIRNQTLSSNAFIQWDGTNNDGELQRVGTYIVYIEILDPAGRSEQYKEVCVLAQRF